METRPTIAERLRQAGYDPAAFDTDSHCPLDAFTPETITGVDGTMVTGIQFFGRTLDEIRERVTGRDPRQQRMNPSASRYLAVFADAPAIALAPYPLPDALPQWGDGLGEYDQGPGQYSTYYRHQLPYTQSHDAGIAHRWLKMKELRAIARGVGLSPMPARKDDLYDALLAHPGYRDKYGHPSRPECYPALDSRTGRIVLRADGGAARIVIDALAQAIEDRTLGIGDPNHPLSGSGFIYDTRDETPAMAARRVSQVDWHDARMAELEPVAAALKAKGHSWHMLGTPAVIAPQGRPKGVYYWLNGASGFGPDGKRPPFGWFSLEELAQEVFVQCEGASPIGEGVRPDNPGTRRPVSGQVR